MSYDSYEPIRVTVKMLSGDMVSIEHDPSLGFPDFVKAIYNEFPTIPRGCLVLRRESDAEDSEEKLEDVKDVRDNDFLLAFVDTSRLRPSLQLEEYVTISSREMLKFQVRVENEMRQNVLNMNLSFLYDRKNMEIYSLDFQRSSVHEMLECIPFDFSDQIQHMLETRKWVTPLRLLRARDCSWKVGMLHILGSRLREHKIHKIDLIMDIWLYYHTQIYTEY